MERDLAEDNGHVAVANPKHKLQTSDLTRGGFSLMAENSAGVIKRYLEDTIAAERSFETQFEGFAKETEDPALQDLFRRHAAETRKQHEQLVARLTTLGGSPSTAKSLLAQLFGLSPKIAQIGREGPERSAQNLMIAFAIENSELALYEALATVAEAAGDDDTADLARSIQAQEKIAAERIWKALPGTAGEPFLPAAEGSGSKSAPAAV